jgi:hypothetical protein
MMNTRQHSKAAWTGGLAIVAAALVSMSGIASAQTAGGGVGGAPATTSLPANSPPSTADRSGDDDCSQANSVGSNCTPKDVGDDTRSQLTPRSGDSGAPMSGSGGTTGTSATQGGNDRTPQRGGSGAIAPPTRGDSQ